VSYADKVPGVYREDVFVRSAVALPTGVPGFVGFGQGATAGPLLLHRAADLATQITVAADGYLADAVAGFFANGGERCYVVGAAGSDREKALKDALVQLGPLNDLDLVAVPDAMTLKKEDEVQDQDAVLRVQKAVLRHCAEHGNRFAILDAPSGKDPALDAVAELQDWRKKLTSGGDNLANAALYYPWVKIPATGVSGGRAVPPCGHVAGIYARSDARVGVFKAPANEELQGLLDLEYSIEAATQEDLNPAGINCLRAFPGRGLRVWGARTLSQDANWRYINVRRLFLTLGRWIDRNLAWAAFEPNTPRLWNRIVRELNTYLDKLWQVGALKGATIAEAFFVKCDAETNPAEEREQGRVTTEIGLAAALPAEFIVVRIIHRAGSTELSP
jgi:phage tail sheath protein FI